MYYTSWITNDPKSNFICDNIPTKANLFFSDCSEVNSTWLITFELANQRARKVLFTCVVYTKTPYSPHWVSVTFLRLVTKLTTFAITASTYKPGGQLLIEIFICSKGITLSLEYLKGWRIYKMTAAALGPKCFQELAFKAFKNRKQWLCWSPAGLIDQFLIFLETKAAHFKTVTITVNEVNIYKINALIRIYFSKRFTAGLECVNWFRIDVNVTRARCISVCKRTIRILKCLEYEFLKIFLVQEWQQWFWKFSILSNILDLEWCRSSL